MANINREQDDIAITIKFAPDSGHPSRVFSTMADLIDSMQVLDRDLLSQFHFDFGSQLVLHDIRRGSLKAILRSIVQDLPDEALKNAEWKKLLGHYLLKGKYAILEWSATHDTIEDRSTLEPLEGQLIKAAEETEIHQIPAYKPISTARLLSNIRDINSAISKLDERDEVSVRSELGQVAIRGNLAISDETIRDLLTNRLLESTTEQTLLVKKPDYLGQSMWSFRYNGHAIEAKILDQTWLNEFQSQRISVNPGNGLRVNLREELYLGYHDEIVLVNYDVTKVHSVVNLVVEQRKLF